MTDKLSVIERCKIAAWMETLGSVVDVRRKFEEEFGKESPARSTIYDIHRRFIDTGSIHDRSRSGRPKSVRHDEHIQAVSEMISS
ncbi:unnamed protein product, partial [Rotaria sp. Silwood2]